MDYFNFVVHIWSYLNDSFDCFITYDAISNHNPRVLIPLISHQGVESLSDPVLLRTKRSFYKLSVSSYVMCSTEKYVEVETLAPDIYLFFTQIIKEYTHLGVTIYIVIQDDICKLPALTFLHSII